MIDEKTFMAHLKEISLLGENLNLLGWDQLTGMPEASGEFRAELTAYLSEQYYTLLTGDKMADFVAYFTENKEVLSDLGQTVFKKVAEDYHRDKQIPVEDYAAFERVTTQAQDAWKKARQANDYQIFAPYLEKIIAFQRDFIQKRRTHEQTPYDVLLGDYEKGMTVAQLDAIFEEVKAGVHQLREQIADQQQAINTDFLSRFVSKQKQRDYSLGAVQRLGYDLDKGRLDDTIHPFMEAINRLDARITTRWDEHDFQMAVMGILHEAGHGIYEQNIDAQYDYTPLSTGTSMGIHESQSLFQEAIVGRSYAFWVSEYPRLQQTVAPALDDISLSEFYAAWVKTQPSLIRVEADALTYPLHIIIRYEIEKAIFNDDLPVEALPQLWRDKYREYLGIDVPDDLTGILQDIHWSGGSFGYFPSYALGHFYAAQMRHAMTAEFNVDDVLQSGDYQLLFDWRKEHVWQYGASKTPQEILQLATGESLNVQYWLDFQRDIYQSI